MRSVVVWLNLIVSVVALAGLAIWSDIPARNLTAGAAGSLLSGVALLLAWKVSRDPRNAFAIVALISFAAHNIALGGFTDHHPAEAVMYSAVVAAGFGSIAAWVIDLNPPWMEHYGPSATRQ